MKKIVLILVLLLAMAGIANAQSLMRGPLRFNISTTEEYSSIDRYGYEVRKLVTKTESFKGDILFDLSPETLPNITIEGTVGDDTAVAFDCPNEYMIGLSAKANNTKVKVNDTVKVIAFCSFHFKDIDGYEGDGYAVLNLSGKVTRPKGADEPSKITLSGSTVNGGRAGGEEHGGFIFKGTFGSVIVPGGE